MYRKKNERRGGVGAASVVAALLLLWGGAALIWAKRHWNPSDWRETAKTLYRGGKRAIQVPSASAWAASPVERADAPLSIFGADGLEKGWADWSWATRTTADETLGGTKGKTLTMTPEGFKGVFLHHDALALAGYGTLTFTVNREAVGQDSVDACLADTGGKFGPKLALKGFVAHAEGSDAVRIEMPLKKLCVDAPAASFISGIVFQARNSAASPPIRLARIALLPDTTLPPSPVTTQVNVSIDTKKEVHAISPLIYGVAFADDAVLRDLHIRSHRWGGNANTRYNWTGEAWNSARDWEWRNHGAAKMGEKPSESADAFVRSAHAAGASVLMTVPTIGWTPKDGNTNTRSRDVPSQGGIPLHDADGPIAGYDPTENRNRTSVRSVPRTRDAKPGEVSQESWVRHLTQVFGPAKSGGVNFFAMDNEPDLWDSTHTDIHPAEMGNDDLLRMFTTYAGMVKDVDPSVQVTGPVSWGWTGYFYSPLDRGRDNFHTHADRDRHGGDPFLLWFLKAVRDQDKTMGRRTLDVLDVHFYPQGGNLFPGGDSPDEATRALRLRSVRALWDPTYQDESWIGDSVRLLPRLREWVAQGYPGTKIGLTEWNFGGEKDISGGLATADALGVFGREDLYMANYWTTPPKNSPSYLAFKLLGNADGNGHGFGDTACRAVSSAPEQVSVYAATDSHDHGALTILLINKMRKATVTVPLTVNPGAISHSSVKRWSFDAAHPGALQQESGPTVTGAGTVKVALPPYSATLLRF